MSVRIATAILCVLAAWPAVAQEKKRDKGKGRLIQIDALKVEGQIQKPEAFYILQKGDVNFKGLEPKKSFLPEIIQSVEREPF
ncbi:hypothetical protein L6V77_09585 [Myxococcota bacterium]|nr:hypothetical protein [Myxococcota bacterium]